ncbi:MAG: tripartite tricarboxylate transporter substrate-binding protein [Nocardioidaceae bacterium]
MMRHQLRTKAAVLAAVAAVAAVALAACGNPQGIGGESESDGEMPSSVELLIPYSEGGGTDTWARFLAPYLEEHVEGSPTYSPLNVEGGESITGSNQFVTEGGTDGSTILVTSGTTYFQALLNRPEVQFDFTKMQPLILNGTGGVIYASADSGIKSVEDLMDPPNPLTYAGISASGLDLSLLQAFDLLDIDVDATFGLEGREDALLALQRGEVNIDYQTTAAYIAQVEPLVEEGKAIPLMSFGFLEDGEIVRDPNVPDLPTVAEVYEKFNGEEPSGQAFEAYEDFLVPGYVYQKGLWANEGTPDSVVQAYYDAVESMQEDPEFRKSSEEVLGGYPLYSGEDAEDELHKAFDIEPEAREYVLNLLETKYGTTIEES